MTVSGNYIFFRFRKKKYKLVIRTNGAKMTPFMELRKISLRSNTNMKIIEDIYYKIIDKCSCSLIEVGGIIGGKNNIITEFEFDKGIGGGSKQHYFPDIEKFNSCIKNWQKENIEFYGIVHSHFQDTKELSFGDTLYIQEIMLAMPEYIRYLYFPIILPQKELVSFKVMRNEIEINIINDNVKIIMKGAKKSEKRNKTDSNKNPLRTLL